MPLSCPEIELYFNFKAYDCKPVINFCHGLDCSYCTVVTMYGVYCLFIERFQSREFFYMSHINASCLHTTFSQTKGAF